MKIRKIITGISAVFMAVVIIATAVPAYAYVGYTRDVPCCGTLKGWQDDLYEEDYHQICWVTMHTKLSGCSLGVRTGIDYTPVDAGTGEWLAEQKGVRSYAPECSCDCYISNYGYYEDTGDVTLYSAHWVECNGVEDVIIYLKHNY